MPVLGTAFRLVWAGFGAGMRLEKECFACETALRAEYILKADIVLVVLRR